MKDIYRYQPKLKAFHLKKIRQMLLEKMKQQDIADKLGVSQPTISRYNRKMKKEKNIIHAN